ncbi:excinuclease ABC subunit UvrA [Holospora curviuscula]|uniref:UvrABC system protein A n=1 Tax=Holospora curviuscula TaxID=1082868 RepID=A0A2S5R9F6_9PROT|nr:excinuclease ABC subunit UvrA [Holospora curviuscula]PPE03832.1 UvrABC system protein A [Holospora curviuscula]
MSILDTRTVICISGARQHNLKNISLSIPKDKLVVITGPSGSGKSSLAFDTLYAEGQRKYVESLSVYARQFLDMMPKPEVDAISGLCPAISIEQKSVSHNPRSTVGTVTEIYDYLRLLFARLGKVYSPATGMCIEPQSASQMVERILTLPFNGRYALLAPIARGEKGEFKAIFTSLKKQGYAKVKVDDQFYDIEDVPKLQKRTMHDIFAVVHRFRIPPQDSNSEFLHTLTQSVEQALRLGNQYIVVEPLDQSDHPKLHLSGSMSCPVSGFSLPEVEPRLFSFNSPYGACSLCDGLGVLSFGTVGEEEEGEDVPVCFKCHGNRLSEAALCVKIRDVHIAHVGQWSLTHLLDWIHQLEPEIEDEKRIISTPILREIKSRLQFLIDVGLSYLALSRASSTLSGGETQRIRLASQIGSGLTGVLYVLDEPSIGLHQRDNDRLIRTLHRLRDLGNTVIVVEHDEDTIRHADHVVDMGPGAGYLGGEIVAQGTPQEIEAHRDSLTGAYLRREKWIPVPETLRPGQSNKVLCVVGAKINNLKNLTVSFPLGKMIGVAGVSGSGKSSLVMDTLCKGVRYVNQHRSLEGICQEISGIEWIDKLIEMDQSPIGRTPRSNVATYTGLFTLIREWFAILPESKIRGYTPSRFSFNVQGGRCEHCKGDGVLCIEMHFLPNVYVTCTQCQGQRYNGPTLEVHYKGKSIGDILCMSVTEALSFFQDIASIHKRLSVIESVGLGYVRIGQGAPTLSGGEAQRVKLAKELMKRSTGKTLYILDEPTTGLHFDDVRQLLELLHRLADQGNTLVIIEHNLDVLKTLDWIIDVGPEGGEAGGYIVVEGTPKTISECTQSYTGSHLLSYL